MITDSRTVFSLSLLQRIMNVPTLWVAAETARAEKIARYRRYFDGDHDSTLTQQMRRMLRAGKSSDDFDVNYCGVVVNTMADRVKLLDVSGDDPTITDWIEGWTKSVRLDALQAQVNEAAIRDGEVYAMAYYDNARGSVCLSLEEAFDGHEGIVSFYPSHTMPTMRAAVKIWQTLAPEGLNTDRAFGANDILTRVNVYYADRVEKYYCVNNGVLESGDLDETPMKPYAESGTNVYWLRGKNGEPLGIPIFHFKNGGRQNHGRSELAPIISVQNALNRFFASSVMMTELGAFRVFFAKGFNPDPEIAPGAIIIAGPDGLEASQQVDFTSIPPADLSQIIAMFDRFEQTLSRISRTPAPEFHQLSGSISGVTLKQLESGLIAKVRRFCLDAGVIWESLVLYVAILQNTYGTLPAPTMSRVYARFADPDIRSDTEVVDNATKAAPYVSQAEVLRLMSDVFGWDSDRIEQIMREKQAETDSAMMSASAGMPGFDMPANNDMISISPESGVPYDDSDSVLD